MTKSPADLIVARRFRGPESSGNGGYTAGLLAGAVGTGPVTVTLRKPPPLDVAMRIVADGDHWQLMSGDQLVAQAQPGTAPRTVAPVTAGVATAAERTYAGLTNHPFPQCFTCGTARLEGDGLRLFPGLIGAGRTACSWTPDASLGNPIVDPAICWAALDCPGGWTSDLEGRPMVLGRMTAALDRLPHVGEPLVVVGELRGAQGRKTFTATTLYDAEGTIVGAAEHTWIAIDPALV